VIHQIHVIDHREHLAWAAVLFRDGRYVSAEMASMPPFDGSSQFHPVAPRSTDPLLVNLRTLEIPDCIMRDNVAILVFELDANGDPLPCVDVINGATYLLPRAILVNHAGA
jgi:hypothetical protein